jgi:2-polyprenyl-3-methyl-5-hydroxy-6-metoxy-1,4-benzoquinol methylase
MLARFITIKVAESPWVGFVSKGTHQFDKYIRPDELARFLHADLGWDTSNFEVCGVNYIPLLGVWRRGRSTRGTDALGRPKVDQQANFFLSARKPHRP